MANQTAKQVDVLGFDRMEIANVRRCYAANKVNYTKLNKLYKKLDLNTGSTDFMVDKDGNYVFLEINPVGQFQMTSAPCNFNIEQKIANYLVYGY